MNSNDLAADITAGIIIASLVSSFSIWLIWRLRANAEIREMSRIDAMHEHGKRAEPTADTSLDQDGIDVVGFSVEMLVKGLGMAQTKANKGRSKRLKFIEVTKVLMHPRIFNRMGVSNLIDYDVTARGRPQYSVFGIHVVSDDSVTSRCGFEFELGPRQN